MHDEISRAIPGFLASASRNTSIERNGFPPLTRIPVAVRAWGASRVYSSCKTREINAWILNSNVETAKAGREGLDPTVEQFDGRRSKGAYTFAGIHEWMRSVSGGPDGPPVPKNGSAEESSSAKKTTVEEVDDESTDSKTSPTPTSGSDGRFTTTTSSSFSSFSSTPEASPDVDGTAASSEDSSSKGSNKRCRGQGDCVVPSAKRSRGKYEWEAVGQLHHYIDEVVQPAPGIESNSVAFKTKNKRFVEEGSMRMPSPKRARASLDLDHQGAADVGSISNGGDEKNIVLPIIGGFTPDYKFPSTPSEPEVVQETESEVESTVSDNNAPNSPAETEAENKSTGIEIIDLSIDEEYFRPIFATKSSRIRENNVLDGPVVPDEISSAQRPDEPTGIRKILSRLLPRQGNMSSWFSTKSSKTLDHDILKPSTISTPKKEVGPVFAHKMSSPSDEASLVPMFPTKSSRILNYNVLLSPIITGAPPIPQQPVVIRKVVSIIHGCNMAKWFATKSSSALDSNVLTRPTTPPSRENKFVRKFIAQSDESCILPMFATKSSRVRADSVFSPPTLPNQIKQSTVTQEVDSDSDEDCFLSMFPTKARRVRSYGGFSSTTSKQRENQSAPIRRIRSHPAIIEDEDISYGFATKSSRVLDKNVLTSPTLTKASPRSQKPPRKNNTVPAFTAKMSQVSDYNVESTPSSPIVTPQQDTTVPAFVDMSSPVMDCNFLTPTTDSQRQDRNKSISKIITPSDKDQSVFKSSIPTYASLRLQKGKQVFKLVSNPKESTILPEFTTKSSGTPPHYDLLSTPIPTISGEIMSPQRLNQNFQLPKSSRLNSNVLTTHNLKRPSVQKEDRPIPTIVITAPDEENITPMFTMASPTLAEVGSSSNNGNKLAVSKKIASPPKKTNIVPMFTTKSSRVLDDNVLSSPPLSETGPGSNIGNKPILPKKIISPPAGETFMPAPIIRASRIQNQNVSTPLNKSAANGANSRRYTPSAIGKGIPKVGKTPPMFVAKSSRIVDENVLSPPPQKTKVGSVLTSKSTTVRKNTISSILKKITPSTSKVNDRTVLEIKPTNVRNKPAAAGDNPPPRTSTPPSKKRAIPTIAIAKGTSPRKYTPTIRKTTAPTVLAEKKDASAFQRESAPVIPADITLPATKTLPTTRQNSLLTTIEKEVTTKQKVTPAIEKFNSKAIRSTAVGGIKIKPMKLTLSLCPKEGRCLRASASSFVPYRKDGPTHP